MEVRSLANHAQFRIIVHRMEGSCLKVQQFGAGLIVRLQFTDVVPLVGHHTPKDVAVLVVFLKGIRDLIRLVSTFKRRLSIAAIRKGIETNEGNTTRNGMSRLVVEVFTVPHTPVMMILDLLTQQKVSTQLHVILKDDGVT